MLQLEAQLAERQVNIERSDEAADWLVEKGYDQQMGARPMGRTIQEYIKKPLADELLFGRLVHGGTVRVIVETAKDGTKSIGFIYISREAEKALPKPVVRKALPKQVKVEKPAKKAVKKPAVKAKKVAKKPQKAR